MNKINEIENDNESLYIVGFKIFSMQKEVDFYTILIYGDNDRPIQREGNILFFAELETASRILIDDFSQNKDLILDCEEVSIIYNIKESLNLIENSDVDDNAIIINSLNMIFDLVKATKIEFQEQYKKILFSFADHLTFDKSISTFFDNTELNRSLVIDSLFWCIGAILSKSILINS